MIKEYTEAEVRLIIEGAIQEEREACAKIADSKLCNMQFLASNPPKSAAAYDIAIAIRARGKE